MALGGLGDVVVYLKSIGALFLLLGLLWGAFLQVNAFMGGGLRSVVLSKYEKLSPEPSHTYSSEDVQKHIRETAVATFRLNRWPGAPVVLVLAGSILLCRSRANVQQAQP